MYAGARVILACRSAERANAARDEIIKSTANEDVIVMSLDLASLSSVKQFAEDFNRSALSVLMAVLFVLRTIKYRSRVRSTFGGVILIIKVARFDRPWCSGSCNSCDTSGRRSVASQ